MRLNINTDMTAPLLADVLPNVNNDYIAVLPVVTNNVDVDMTDSVLVDVVADVDNDLSAVPPVVPENAVVVPPVVANNDFVVPIANNLFDEHRDRILLTRTVLDICGLSENDHGRACNRHGTCGHFVQLKDVLYCKNELQDINGELRDVVKVYMVNVLTGLAACHVGYIPERYFFLSSRAAFGVNPQSTEIIWFQLPKIQLLDPCLLSLL
jgi:hypothetical protein